MFRQVKAFIYDPISWGLAAFFLVILAVCASTLVNRYDRVDSNKLKLYQLEYDIQQLTKERDAKTEWLARLEDDPAAWEQVAREKMNYLGPNEVLVTFVPQGAVGERTQ